MPAIYHEGSWLGNATDPEVLVKDTVGWTGKNRLKVPASVVTQTINGITLTVTRNSDGEVTEIDANGTATGYVWIQLTDNLWNILESDIDYILSGCDANGGANKYALQPRITIGSANTALEDSERTFLTDYGAGVTFNLNNLYEAVNHTKVSSSSGILWVGLRIDNGATVNHVKFYPMIRRAAITDPTYEPYHESVEEEIEQIYADNGVLGAKNLLKNNATSQTINGVTFTVNSDGSITANGTASAIAFLPIVPNNTMTIEKGSYILSAGDGIVGNYSKYGLYINNASGDIANTRTEERTHFTLSADTLFAECKIFVTSGTTVSNLTFYPMIRLASDPDDTYQPHAMTNRELTDEKINIADLKTVVSASSDFADFKTRIASL